MTEWRDAKGAPFRGEPVEAMGPLALFRTGATSSKFVPMPALTSDECVRFHRAIANRPARAARWSEAKGKATSEFVGRLLRVENRELQPVDLTALPEPELLLVFFGSWRTFASFQLLDNLAPFATRVQRVYAGRVATVVMTTWERNFSTGVIPRTRTWLVADPGRQSGMKVLSRFVPGEGFVVMLMTREGVPLIGGPVETIFDVTKFVDQASAVLWELNPLNPVTWQDRAHYLRAVRPVEFAGGRAEPLLLLDPFRADVLRQRSVVRIAAKVEVDAEGGVTQVTMLPASEFPAALARPLGEAIRRSGLFLPAIDHGVPVARTLDYALVVPPADPQLAADAAWVSGEARVPVPIENWLVLKPIHVSEQVFSTVDRISPDGTVILKPVTAGDGSKFSTAVQLTAFNSDWFAADGAASVHPAEGAMQEVDGEKLVWKRLKADDGIVDFAGNVWNMNYCVGYAWAEFDSPVETDAWLGIGSDDGLKVWFNGELVNDKWVLRTSRLDDDVVPLRLRKGKNQILIKIQNATEAWKFTFRLRVRGA